MRIARPRRPWSPLSIRRALTPLCLALLAIAAALSPRAEAQISRPPFIGGPAPELSLDRLIQAPKDAIPTLEGLHNKVATLLFWSPTCENCQAEFPHMIELINAMPASRYVFIGVVNAPAQSVIDFLKQTPIPGWVGIDQDWSMVRDFGAPGTPFAVVINRRGLIAAFTHPQNLTPGALQTVWEGGAPDIDMGNPMGWQPRIWRDAPPMFELSITPASPTREAIFQNGPMLGARSVPLRELIAYAYRVPASRVTSNTFLLDATYDVTIAPKPGLSVAEAQQANTEALRQLLETVFPIRKRPMTQDMDVYLLTAPDGQPSGLSPSAAESGSLQKRTDGFVAQGVTTLQIAEQLTRELDRPVIDDTGLKGRFNAVFTFERGDTASVITAAQRMGLVLAPARAPVEVFNVERGDMAPTPLPEPAP